jgi:hypothetical protein
VSAVRCPGRSVLARRVLLALGLVCLGASQLGCEDAGLKSAQLAEAHAGFLAAAVTEDVREVRDGLPRGAPLLAPLFEAALPERPDSESARAALSVARDKVQDLRTAKSTFFAVVTRDGYILRNDREADEMAGKQLFASFPTLASAVERGYTEALGTMPEAAGVRGRPDAQWVAAAPVAAKGQVVGLYLTGWSLAAYAYRLETALRSDVLSNTPSGGKVPLLYVYVLAGGGAHGAPVAPVVNGEAILRLDPLAKTKGDAVWSAPLDIEGRRFGVAVRRTPALGADMAVAVLRSET